MTKRRSVSTLAVSSLVLLLATSAALAHGHEPPKEEQVIEYRRSAFHVLGWNFGPMAGAIQGKIPFDRARVALQATRVAQVVPMLGEGFAKGSYVAGKTDAKPAIWENWDDFEKRLHDLEAKSAAFAELAQGGDLAKLKPALGELAQVCKGCHEKYRHND